MLEQYVLFWFEGLDEGGEHTIVFFSLFAERGGGGGERDLTTRLAVLTVVRYSTTTTSKPRKLFSALAKSISKKCTSRFSRVVNWSCDGWTR